MLAVNVRIVRLVVLPLAALLAFLVLPAAAQAAVKPGDNEIQARWAALGAESGPLGAKLPPPNDRPRDVTGGRAQDFAGGSIFWSEATGAWDIRGAFRDLYVSAGGPDGTLGFPANASEPAGVPDAEQQV